MNTCYHALTNWMGYHEGDKVWIYHPTHMKGKSPKLESPSGGPYRVAMSIKIMVCSIYQTLDQRQWRCTWTYRQFIRETFETMARAAEGTGQKSLGELRHNEGRRYQSQKSQAQTALRARRNDSMFVGYLGQTALRREQWEIHLVLDNNHLTSKHNGNCWEISK
jgi:hypothetical protein